MTIHFEERWPAERTLADQFLELSGKLRGETGKVEGTARALERAADRAVAETPVPTESVERVRLKVADGEFAHVLE